MTSLVIPPNDDAGTYSNRRLQAGRVVKQSKDGSVTGSHGWTALPPKNVYKLLVKGKAYIVETVQLSLITGWLIDGVWYDRKTDEQLEQERKERLANWERQKQDRLERERSDLERRESELPPWIRSRIETFHERGGEKFARDGWGYETTVAELAVLYADLGTVILDKDVFELSDFESQAIKDIAEAQGTSGNQHSMALALAKRHLRNPDESLADTVSALTPLTGDLFYEGGKQ